MTDQEENDMKEKKDGKVFGNKERMKENVGRMTSIKEERKITEEEETVKKDDRGYGKKTRDEIEKNVTEVEEDLEEALGMKEEARIF